MKGIHVPFVTHFDEALNIDHDAVAADVERLVGAGVHGIVANGTIGEGDSLSREERREVVATAVGAAKGRVPVSVGVSASSAEQVAVYGRDALGEGAECLMLKPPLQYRADRRELGEFFGSVARAVDLPIMLYNTGGSSDLMPELLAALIQEVPSITSIKEASGDARRIAELVGRSPQTAVLVGGDDWAMEGFCAGAAGWVSGTANAFPAGCVQLWELCQVGDLEPAREVYQALLPLCRLDVTPKLVQYFKAALAELNLGDGPCRPPRLPLTDVEQATVREALARGTQRLDLILN